MVVVFLVCNVMYDVTTMVVGTWAVVVDTSVKQVEFSIGPYVAVDLDSGA